MLDDVHCLRCFINLCIRIMLFNDFDVDDVKILTFMQVFIASHGCVYEELQYFQMNFNTFAIVKSETSIFIKEFQYF